MTGIKIDVPSVALNYDKKALRDALKRAGQEIADATRRLIRGSASPSKPGQAPGSRTGTLAKSISVQTTANSVKIIDKAPYALFLESGAVGGGGKKGSGKMRRHRKQTIAERIAAATTQRVLEPRPYLSTVLEERETSITERIGEAIRNGTKFEKIK